MAEAKSITFRPAVPSDAQVVVAIVNGAYRGDATGRGWTSEARFLAHKNNRYSVCLSREEVGHARQHDRRASPAH